MRLLAFAFTIVFVWTGPKIIPVGFIHICTSLFILGILPPNSFAFHTFLLYICI